MTYNVFSGTLDPTQLIKKQQGKSSLFFFCETINLNNVSE